MTLPVSLKITLPLRITFEKWAAQIQIDLPNLNFPTNVSISKWREWGSQVIASNALTRAPVPTKLAYPDESDWQKWATYFIDSVMPTNTNTNLT